MAEMDDLKGAMDKLTTAVTSTASEMTALEGQIKALQAQVAAGQTINPADVEAMAQKASGLADTLNAAVATAGAPAA